MWVLIYGCLQVTISIVLIYCNWSGNFSKLIDLLVLVVECICGIKHILYYIVRVHMLSDGTSQSEGWISDTLMPMLDSLNVTVECNIAGRPWVMEIPRLIKTGCKIIVVVTKDSLQVNCLTNQFSIKLVQAVSLQNFNIFDPVVIPVLLNCELTDLQDSIQELLSIYTLVRHDQVNTDRLEQSLFYLASDTSNV